MPQPGSPNIDPEQAAAILDSISLGTVRRAGDEQLGAHELAARDIASRQFDLPHDLSLRRDLDDPALAVDGMPDVAVLVDTEPIGAPGAFVRVKDALVGQAAVGNVIIPCDHLLGGGVGEEDGLSVRRPANRVGYDNFGPDGLLRFLD